MPDYLVFQYSGPGKAVGPPRHVEAETAEKATEYFYGHAIVVPCEVFPKEQPR